MKTTPEKQDLLLNTLEHQEIIVPILDLLGSFGHSGNSSAQSGSNLVRLWWGVGGLPPAPILHLVISKGKLLPDGVWAQSDPALE